MQQIPKIVHYCWFGDTKQSRLITDCVATWKKHLPDYQFNLWNEDNFQSENSFYRFAYEHKKWAYVSDYARLKILYDNGGIYLDTDMFFTRPLDVSFLNQTGFFGAENINLISCGIIGVIPKHPFIKLCLDFYEQVENHSEHLKKPITKVITEIFRRRYQYHEEFHKTVSFKDITIYAIDYFYPYPFNINKALNKNFIEYATSNTYAIHLWNGSWHNYNEFHLIRRRSYYKGIKKMIFNILKNKITDKEYYRKVFVAFKKSIRDT